MINIVSFEGEDYCAGCLPKGSSYDNVRFAVQGVCSVCGEHEPLYPEADEDSRVDPLNFEEFEEEREDLSQFEEEA